MRKDQIEVGEHYLYRRGEHGRCYRVEVLEAGAAGTTRSWNGYSHTDRAFSGARVKVIDRTEIGWGEDFEVGSEHVVENRWIACRWAKHSARELEREIHSEARASIEDAKQAAAVQLAGLWTVALDAIDFAGEEPGGKAGSPETYLVIADLFCEAGATLDPTGLEPVNEVLAEAREVRQLRDDAIEKAERRRERRIREEVHS